MHLKFETSEVGFFFFFFLGAPPIFGAFLWNNQFYMICLFLCLISLSCFQMFTLDNSIGIFTFSHPYMGACLDVYTYNLCQQVCFLSSLVWTYAWVTFILAIFVCKFIFLRPYVDLCMDSFYTCISCQKVYFPSSLCGLMHGQLLDLQFLLASLLSFVLMRTYAWIAFILAILVSKFAFLRPYVDLCMDSFYTCNSCQQVCFPLSLCGLMHGQLSFIQECYRLSLRRAMCILLGILSSLCG